MLNKYQYKVSIKFSAAKVGANIYGLKDVEGYVSKGNVTIDKFKFCKTKVDFIAVRPYYLSKDDLTRTENGIHLQILKGILLYYANCLSFPKIKSIDVDIKEILPDGNIIDLRSYNYQNIGLKQIVRGKQERKNQLHFTPQPLFYYENENGTSLRIALSHWLESMLSENENIKFDRLWTAVNTLYSYYDRRDRLDNVKMLYFKNEIKTHKANFPLTMSLVTSYTAAKLKEYRWMSLCENVLNRHSIEDICKFMQRYDDERIQELFFGLIGDPLLSDKVLHATERANLMMKFAAPSVREDIDIVLLIGLRYAYFLRNQKQHGNILDYAFKLWDMATDNELPQINEILSMLILEILENPTTLSVKV